MLRGILTIFSDFLSPVSFAQVSIIFALKLKLFEKFANFDDGCKHFWNHSELKIISEGFFLETY